MLSSVRNRKGYTLLEALITIAIVVIVAAIAIPSIITMNSTLRYKQMEDYAKTVFMAAQDRLTEIKIGGGLPELAAAKGADYVPAAKNDGFPTDEDTNSEYMYALSSAEDPETFNLLLPVGSIDETLRSQQILVEYSPASGNIYSVYYREGAEPLGYDALADMAKAEKTADLRHSSDARKEFMIGYYEGSIVVDSGLSRESDDEAPASITVDNGQELKVTISVEIPNAYRSISRSLYIQGLNIDLHVEREDKTLSHGSGEIDLVSVKPVGSVDGCTVSVDGKSIEFTYVLDSLRDYRSFANISAFEAGSLTSILNEEPFSILPGENLTITADVSFENMAGYPAVNIDNDLCSAVGVSSLFEKFEGGVIYISNGRHLQNLNALAPTVAEGVREVRFSKDIDWAETSNYYNENYGNYGKNRTTEAPARQLPCFVPLDSAILFGTDTEAGKVTVTGSGAEIKNLYINTNIYANGSTATKYYRTWYAGTNALNNARHTGLFARLNTKVTGLTVTDPTVTGYGSAEISTGALTGVLYSSGELEDCAVCITEAQSISSSILAGSEAWSSSYQTWKGISGKGTVGGLVGSCFGKLTNCSAVYTGGIPVSGTSFGGLVGTANGAVIASPSVSGSITGGGGSRTAYAGLLAGSVTGSSITDAAFGTGASISGVKTSENGMVGAAAGYISESVMTNANTITYSISVKPAATLNAGGLFGQAEDLTLINAMVSGEVEGAVNAGGLAGKIYSSELTESGVNDVKVSAHTNAGGVAAMISDSTVTILWAVSAHVSGAEETMGCAAGVLDNSAVDNSGSNSAVISGDISGSVNYAGGFAGRLTGKDNFASALTVSSALTIYGGRNTCAGGFAGSSEVTLAGHSVNVTMTAAPDCASLAAGGAVGMLYTGTSLSNMNITGSVKATAVPSAQQLAVIYVGGAVGKEESGSNYTTVYATVDLGDWGQTSNTSVYADPSGLGVNVGKFIGYVNNGEFADCRGLGKAAREYQFLGTIVCDTGATVTTSAKTYYLGQGSYQGIEYTQDDATVKAMLAAAELQGTSSVTLHVYRTTLGNNLGCLYSDNSGTPYFQTVNTAGYYAYEDRPLLKRAAGELTEGATYYILSYDNTYYLGTDGTNPIGGNFSALAPENDGTGNLFVSSTAGLNAWRYRTVPDGNSDKNLLLLQDVSSGKYLFWEDGINSNQVVLTNASTTSGAYGSNYGTRRYEALYKDGVYLLYEYYSSSFLWVERYYTNCLKLDASGVAFEPYDSTDGHIIFTYLDTNEHYRIPTDMQFRFNIYSAAPEDTNRPPSFTRLTEDSCIGRTGG